MFGLMLISHFCLPQSVSYLLRAHWALPLRPANPPELQLRWVPKVTDSETSTCKQAARLLPAAGRGQGSPGKARTAGRAEPGRGEPSPERPAAPVRPQSDFRGCQTGPVTEGRHTREDDLFQSKVLCQICFFSLPSSQCR